MVSMKTVPANAAATSTKRGRDAARGATAALTAHSAAAREALAAAKAMPGWGGVRSVLGAAVAAGDTALLLEARGQTVALRRRVKDAWQPATPIDGDDAAATFAAFRKLAASSADGEDEPEYDIAIRKHPARACRLAARAAAAGADVLVLIGAEQPRERRPRFGRRLQTALLRLVPAALKRKPVVHHGPVLPKVTLEPTGPDAAARQAALAAADGYASACELVAAAVQDRAGAIIVEAGPKGTAVHFEVDGVARPAPALDPIVARAVVGVFEAVAGLDPKVRGPQSAPVNAMVEGKAWPCTVTARRGSAGARITLAIESGRPRFKTLADLGMPTAVIDRLQEFLKLESGLILLTAPPRGGLSTLFDGVLGAADRLLRDFVVFEDAAAPRPEIQNVRPVRWDARTGGAPLAALETALREYANVLAVCDLEDAEFAKRLVAEAGDGKLVIVGLRGADAAEGLARLVGLGVDPHVLARVLLGAVGSRLVRKLCPKCREEYFPSIDTLVKLKVDLGADVTMFRASASGCAACTGTGYLGRTAVGEIAAGPTLRAYIAKAAAADVLRKAAVKDGMVTLMHDAIAKAGAGATSVDEIQRVFRKG